MAFEGIERRAATWVIPTEIWNHAVRKLWRGRPRSGKFCLLLELPDGTLVSADPRVGWKHPWFTEPRWAGKRWVATVKPGFINERDPVVPGGGRDESGQVVDGDLTDRADMTLNGFRSVPGEGDPIPPFFAVLGVVDLRPKLNTDELGGVTVSMPDIPPNPRALVAVDFYIAKARATYQGRAQEIDESGVTGVTVDYSVTFNTDQLDRVGSLPRLMQAPMYPAVKPPTLAERLTGQYQDAGEDRILVSTVFLLSPPGVLDGEPDARWTPFVRHSLFWNLSHEPRNIPPARDPQPIRLWTGLAFGLGDVIGNQILSGVNEYADVVLNAVNTTTNEGRFWTG